MRGLCGSAPPKGRDIADAARERQRPAEGESNNSALRERKRYATGESNNQAICKRPESAAASVVKAAGGVSRDWIEAGVAGD